MCPAADHKGAIHRKDIIREWGERFPSILSLVWALFHERRNIFARHPSSSLLAFYTLLLILRLVHLFNLFVSSPRFLDARLSFSSSAAITFFIERISLILSFFFFFFHSSFSSFFDFIYIYNRDNVKDYREMSKNVGFMVDGQSFREYARMVRRKRAHTFHIYGRIRLS